MKLDELSKDILKELNFDDIMDPDMTDQELTDYYEGLLKESKEQNDKQSEDKIVEILTDMIESGIENE